MNLTKSRYCTYLHCPKHCYLDAYKSDQAAIDNQAQQRFEEGNLIGDMAMGYFGDFVEVTTYKADGTLDIAAMLHKTQQLITDGTDNICEASFAHNGLFCSVDILRKEKGGYAIYEVKNSTTVKQEHLHDIAFQKHVLELCGINVTGAYIMHIDKDYARNGNIDIRKLFVIQPVMGDITDHGQLVVKIAPQALATLNNPSEPIIQFASKCTDCVYWKYCTKGVAKPSVLELRGNCGKWKWYNNGIKTMNELLVSSERVGAKQQLQADHEVNDRAPFVDKVKLRLFLSTLTTPLYFLDFETMSFALPPYDNVHPNESIPFQYSLHYVESVDGEVKHKEFLGEPESDPRRALAEQLCNDIPADVCTLAWHASVEKDVIEKLAATFPDLARRLLNIHSNILDLEYPFSHQLYYNKRMQGRSSIKYVLPALFPDDSTADYHNLEGVHNGTEAMTSFPKMKDMSPQKRAKTRKDLLDYCALDTRAMVRIWKELLRVSK